MTRGGLAHGSRFFRILGLCGLCTFIVEVEVPVEEDIGVVVMFHFRMFACEKPLQHEEGVLCVDLPVLLKLERLKQQERIEEVVEEGQGLAFTSWLLNRFILMAVFHMFLEAAGVEVTFVAIRFFGAGEHLPLLKHSNVC
jgi:hypothetical protein